MRTRRACDRCHKIKARCTFDGPSETCARCSRLGHECFSEKPNQHLQRSVPIDEQYQSYFSGVHPGGNCTMRFKQPSPWPQTLTREDRINIDFLLQPVSIASLVYGQTFQDSMLSALAAPIFIAADQLKDGYVALAIALAETKNTSLVPFDQTTHTFRGSKALQILRKFKSSTIEDARIALSLALVLVTYNDLKIGGPSLPIARSALLQARPFWRSLAPSEASSADPNMICLLFCEVFECLVLGQLPVFWFESDAPNQGLDRYYGVCHDLLPTLYDICLLYKAIKERSIPNSYLVSEIRRLSSVIESWMPVAIIAERTSKIEDLSERQHFLLQAKSFKCATELLLIQAQRSAGMDLLASAKAIQLEHQIVQARQSGIGKPKYLLFPYFVACLELSDSREGQSEEIMNTMIDISNGNAPKSCETMVALLEHIGQTKRRKPELTWFQCVNEQLQIAMGP